MKRSILASIILFISSVSLAATQRVTKMPRIVNPAIHEFTELGNRYEPDFSSCAAKLSSGSSLPGLNLKRFSKNDIRLAAEVLSMLNFEGSLFHDLVNAAQSPMDLSAAVLLTRGFSFVPEPTNAAVGRLNDPAELRHFFLNLYGSSGGVFYDGVNPFLERNQGKESSFAKLNRLLSQPEEWRKNQDLAWRLAFHWIYSTGVVWQHIHNAQKTARQNWENERFYHFIGSWQPNDLDPFTAGPYQTIYSSTSYRGGYDARIKDSQFLDDSNRTIFHEWGRQLNRVDVSDFYRYLKNYKLPKSNAKLSKEEADQIRKIRRAVHHGILFIEKKFDEALSADELRCSQANATCTIGISLARENGDIFSEVDIRTHWNWYFKYIRDQIVGAKGNSPIMINGTSQLIANILSIYGPMFYARGLEIFKPSDGVPWDKLSFEARKGRLNQNSYLRSQIHTLIATLTDKADGVRR